MGFYISNPLKVYFSGSRVFPGGCVALHDVQSFSKIVHFLPKSWKWKMGSWKMCLVSKRACSTSMITGGRVVPKYPLEFLSQSRIPKVAQQLEESGVMFNPSFLGGMIYVSKQYV